MGLWLLTGNSEQVSAEEHKEIKCRKSSIMFCAVRLFLKQSIPALLSSRWEWACSELRFVGTVFCGFVTKAADWCTIWPIAFKGSILWLFLCKAHCGLWAPGSGSKVISRGHCVLRPLFRLPLCHTSAHGQKRHKKWGVCL